MSKSIISLVLNLNDNFDFFPSSERFQIITGSMPILITSVHHHKVTPQDYKENPIFNEITPEGESKHHYCDILARKLIEDIDQDSLFYIVKNQISRKIVDMNRNEATLNDNIVENDALFRQCITFILKQMKKMYDKIPVLIDLHSYNENHYGTSDICLLIQTKKNTKTNNELVDFTIKFFQRSGISITTSEFHNQDDVVEEVAKEKIAIPLLIELNENILNSKRRYLKIKNTFKEYLVALNERNTLKNYTSKAFDSLFRRLKLKNKLYRGLKKKKKIKDDLIKKEFVINRQLKILYKNLIDQQSLLNKTSDSINLDNYSNFDDGYSYELIMQYVIDSLSKDLDTFIIPIELIFNYLVLLYMIINRNELQEWNIIEETTIKTICNFNKSELYSLKFKDNPVKNEEYGIIYKSYKVDGEWFVYVVYLDSIGEISKKKRVEGMEKIKKFEKDGILDSNKLSL